MRKIILFTFSFLVANVFTPQTFALTDLCALKSLENSATLSEGRVRPLLAPAREFRKHYLHPNSCKEISNTALYCYLSLGEAQELEEKYHCELGVKVEHQQLKKILKLTSDYLPLAQARKLRDQVLQEFQQEQEANRAEGSYATASGKFLASLRQIDALEQGGDWKVRVPPQNEWETINQIPRENLMGVISQQVLFKLFYYLFLLLLLQIITKSSKRIMFDSPSIFFLVLVNISQKINKNFTLSLQQRWSIIFFDQNEKLFDNVIDSIFKRY